MRIKEVIDFLENWAPPVLQEKYDNSGLIVGNQNENVTGVIVCLDSVEEVLDEAIAKGCNLIVAHHPIVFSGLKRITGRNYIERTIIKAIKNDIAIYAIHTNLDNVPTGVNAEIGKRLGLKNLKILSPKPDLLSMVSVYVPRDNVESVKSEMFKAGAGEIGNYDECGFAIEGKGTFRPLENANPAIGKVGNREEVDEVKVECVVDNNTLGKVLAAIMDTHPYEEVAHHIIPIRNTRQDIGSGMYGELDKAVDLRQFLNDVKSTFKCGSIRYTRAPIKKVKKVAFCGGSGSFLLGAAKKVKADVFITGDYKYHQFFDAENDIVIADIGHYESEQFTIDLIATVLKKKFSKFAVHFTEVNTNPINYL